MELETVIDVDLDQILNNYFYRGLYPGSFYKAVIHNDLRSAMMLAHPLIHVKQTINFVDRWLIEHNINMEFLPDVD